MRIIGWDRRYARDVERISREWIERDFVSKDVDEAYYADPEAMVLPAGGEIFLALDGDACVGTCAAKVLADGRIELSKLGVTDAAKGRGIGRALCERVLAFARDRGAPTVVLLTNSGLRPALALYESMGFVRRPLPFDQPHMDADVYMELDIDCHLPDPRPPSAP